MKKILLTMLSILMLSGCGATATSTASSKPKVYTSFYAIYDFATKIGGDKVEVVNLVPSGTEPHDWEPSTQDMLKLSKAEVLFYNGLGMESWVDKVKSSVNNEKLQYVELSQAVSNTTAADPHIWLDPENVKLMSQQICDTLSSIDPDNTAFYKTNLINFSNKLDALDSEFKTSLTGISNNKLVVSHEAYSYLCSAYGLEQCPIDGISADSEPSPAKMKEIISYIQKNNIKYIFYEELLSPKTAQTIANETGAQLLSLNPYEGLTQEDIAAGADYLSVMKQNLTNILQATK